jgi:site-specific DNA recombinase
MADGRKMLRCAVYTRKSSEHGLEQDFNSLDAQREAAEAYIKSQAHEGWKLIKTHYADGGLSGGTLERPALQTLLGDIRARKIDVVVVYKVDRLTRSLADFAKLVELFEAHGVSFVSVTQQFNTTTSMGRLTLNVLLSFAQFEREIAGERIRDKFAASRRKGMWMGGTIPLGYDVEDRKLIVNAAEAETVRLIFERYLALDCVSKLRVARTLGLTISRSGEECRPRQELCRRRCRGNVAHTRDRQVPMGFGGDAWDIAWAAVPSHERRRDAADSRPIARGAHSGSSEAA